MEGLFSFRRVNLTNQLVEAVTEEVEAIEEEVTDTPEEEEVDEATIAEDTINQATVVADGAEEAMANQTAEDTVQEATEEDTIVVDMIVVDIEGGTRAMEEEEAEEATTRRKEITMKAAMERGVTKKHTDCNFRGSIYHMSMVSGWCTLCSITL